MTEPSAESLYDSLAATPEGARALASARLRHDVLAILHTVYAASKLDHDDLAGILGIGKYEVKNVFEGDGDIALGTLALFLAAMGFEAQVGAVRSGLAQAKFLGSEKSTTAVCPNPYRDGTCHHVTCARCGEHTNNNSQGHWWSLCNVTRTWREHHFCCPGDCELEKKDGE